MDTRTEADIIKNWEGDINTPLVSICTITYNHAQFIEEALDSFLMQKTNFAFEIIIDDDFSTDNTPQIIQKYTHKYPTIIKKNLRNKNVGMMTNFIENMQKANGKYIALCEGDDYWTDSLKLQKQADFLINNPLYIGCFHDSTKVYEGEPNDTKQYLRIGSRKIEENVDLISIINENNIATASIVFKNFLEEIPKYWRETSKGDYALMILIAKHGTIKYLPEVMSAYRIHNTSIWSSRSGIYKEKEAVKFYHLLQEHFLDNSHVLNTLSKKLKYTYYLLSRKLVYDKQRLKSFYYMLLSLNFLHDKHPNIRYYTYFKELLRSIIK